MIVLENLRQKPIHSEYVRFEVDSTEFITPKACAYNFQYRNSLEGIPLYRVLQNRRLSDFFGYRKLEIFVSNVPGQDRDDFYEFYHGSEKDIVSVDYICHSDLFIMKNCNQNYNSGLLFFPDDIGNRFITLQGSERSIDDFMKSILFYVAENLGNHSVVNSIPNEPEIREHLFRQLQYYLTHSPNSRRKDDRWLGFDHRWR